MYSKGYKTPGKADTSPATKTNGKTKEPRFSKSLDQQSAKNIKSTEFPPRKRSIPLGFDFDLDEVWGPSNPMLKNVFKERGLESSSTGSSDNSLGASHRRMSQGKRSTSAEVRANNRTISEDSGEEFAVDDENVFQKIETLAKTLEGHNLKDRNSSSDSNQSSNLGSGLPSARTLRGGQSVVARGRHSTYDGASSSTISMPGSASQSLYSTGSRGSSLSGSGRYDGTVSPLQSPRRHNNQLTPGLGGEVNRRNRRNRQMDEQRSMSVSPSMRN
ncbi:uncharacterized protein LOC131881129 [Tigriopus californicus]|uniref:uncharacterized protein LOC131881129 n=1 Tax=Tigriopus californicus TaxID=6832 RepID=UPI0027DA9235|nr:uncharacterized protein LOC131881129 [Tigriopus californicus]